MHKTGTSRVFTAGVELLMCPLLAGAEQYEGGITLKQQNFYLGGGLDFNSLPGFGSAVGAGLDADDDDGLMVGAGIGYKFNNRAS